MNGITDYINNSSNSGREVVQTIASITLEKGIEAAAKAAGMPRLGKVAGTVAGALVQPAVWLISGKAPKPSDIATCGTGVWAGLAFGGLGGAASAGAGVVKFLVDDRVDARIRKAVAKEPERYRPFITSVEGHGWAGTRTLAMNIASDGGTAWRIEGNTWVYIKDARGRLVCDYEPASALEVYGPDLPLRISKRRGGELKYQDRPDRHRQARAAGPP
jgi:hypothetical protein